MSYGTENVGTGAYTDRDIVLVSRDGLYASSYELMVRHSTERSVLDIGCSDGVGTYGLPPAYRVIGIDFDPESVRLANTIAGARTARGEGPQYQAMAADLLNLPDAACQIISEAGVDCVSALDVLEHFTRDDAVAIMRSIRHLVVEDHCFIVSMPILSPLSIESWREVAKAVRAGRRPASGLLDRTHLILRGKRFHRKLFAEAGYEVVEEYQTDHVAGATGDWSWKAGGTSQSHLLAERERRRSAGSRVAAGVTRGYAMMEKRPLTRRLAEGAFAYQGLYLLRPSTTGTLRD